MTTIHSSPTLSATYPSVKTLHQVFLSFSLITPCTFILIFSSSKGTVIGTILAHDSDTGDFGEVTYLMDRRSSKVYYYYHRKGARV